MRAAAALAILFALSGCLKHLETANASDFALLRPLEHGRTTRAEIVERLGKRSSRTFENARIVIYRLKLPARDAAPQRITAWEPYAYSLVLVFDEKDLLREHSLVSVR